MEKPKRWQFYLIVAIIALTLFNILPTLFFYTKPLKQPITKERADNVALQIIQRVNALEKESQDWLLSFCKLLGMRPETIQLKKDDPGLFEVTFKNSHDAEVFKRFLPRAGSLIPFVPAQLELYPGESHDPNTVLVSRQINIDLDPTEASSYFQYYPKMEGEHISELFHEHINDRAEHILLGFGGPSKLGTQLVAIVENPADQSYNDSAMTLAKDIVDYRETLGADHPVTQRIFASFTQVDTPDRENLMQKFATKLDGIKTQLKTQVTALEEEKAKLQKENKSFDAASEQKLAYLSSQMQTLDKAQDIIKSQKAAFQKGGLPLTEKEIAQELDKSWKAINLREPQQIVSLQGKNPFVENLTIDWSANQIMLNFYDDVQQVRASQGKSESEAYARDKLNHDVINDIARVSRLTEESMRPLGNAFAVNLTELTDPQSFLSFNLGFLAKKQRDLIVKQLMNDWTPTHTDLQRKVYPIFDYEKFMELNPQERKLGILVYAPAMYTTEPPAGFHATSLYVIARGLDPILQKYKETPKASGAEALKEDVEKLTGFLKNKGFISYSGASYGTDKAFSQDVIFELEDYYNTLLKATREDFYVKGNKASAVLDFTDVEQRIIATNKIEDKIQEDLVKWRDEYNAAQVDIDITRRYDVPAPTKNVFVQNFLLSLRKYVRGDDRKVLRWGLDLSGGKTVRIGLRDLNNRPVTNPDDLQQAVNELYTRINKMGVAERTIRVESNNIILDFPGSQAMSATELVKASAMYFHIVNEKFGMLNANLHDAVNQFLQNVWNEAVVTNRKDLQSVNEIAWEHLGGSLQTGQPSGQPRNAYAKTLFDNGLRLASPRDTLKSPTFDDTLSSVAIMRGEGSSEWGGQTHPLVIVFHNYALEGASLTNIQVGYDPAEGNILSFSVKRSYEAAQAKGGGSPRDDFYAWTSQFSEDKIAGTPKEAYSQGRGWRMAVVLNDEVITNPHLRASLRDSATISGRFTQREITQLAADLKAGSLSFTPRILSEQNVSAELGKEERTKGIIAALVGLFLVAAAMIGYYHFAGVVAMVGVLFNLLILWGVLQNIGAALTLPGIAGIVLTMGMAVDANVLVFERVREEFRISGRIASAIHAGYRKAFSAIFDSNITTILAALILIQFDSGPIRGFAVTLIIGLVSSMFTSLFMTRYYFARWVQNPNHKSLSMAELVRNPKIDFLGYTKPAVIISIVLILFGGFLFYTQKATMFGMDFTGGYSMNVNLEESLGKDASYRTLATEALLNAGASTTDVQIRELSRPNQLRIQLSLGIEEYGHPFFQMPETLQGENFTYGYESNPRIVWVVDALKKEGLLIQKTELENLKEKWSMMSGQFSETMRNNAIIALAFATFCILIYITFRFEFKFAISAVIALGHDVIITLGILALFHKAGYPVTINLQVVGAVMTLIGYSLNDTIIVFDRIREDTKILRKLKYNEIINHAINVTLSRTIMTASTTLLALLSLVLLGGQTIFDFSLVMTIGIFVGTFSSLFIAAPLLLYFHNKEEKLLDQNAAY